MTLLKRTLKKIHKSNPMEKPNHNNKSWETEIDWAKELLHNFDIDYQTKENIVDKSSQILCIKYTLYNKNFRYKPYYI